MVFQGDVVTITAPGSPNQGDSGSGGLGPHATGSITSQNFLVAPKLKPGEIQELVHGTTALLTTPGNIEVIVRGDWNRTIESYEKITIHRDATHEHDDPVSATFDTPGELINNYYNGDVRRYYLDGHSITINETLTEEIGLGKHGGEVTLQTIRYGDDQVHVYAWPNSDVTNVYGDMISVHTGSRYEWTAAAFANRFVLLGPHHESFTQGAPDPTSMVQQLHDGDKSALVSGLDGIAPAFQKGFKGMASSDPARVPDWNAPQSASWPQVKNFVFLGANINLKSTLEFTYATMRAAWSLWGGSFRAVHSFLNGWNPVLKALKAGFDALHANFAALCGRVIATLGLGPPRAPAPTPPTAADISAAEQAAVAAIPDAIQAGADIKAADEAIVQATDDVASADEAVAQAQAQQATADQLALDRQAAQSTANDLAAEQAGAQNTADSLLARQSAAETAAGQFASNQAAAQLTASQLASDLADAQLAAGDLAAQQQAAQNLADQLLADGAPIDQVVLAQARADVLAAQQGVAQAQADLIEADQVMAQARADLLAAQREAVQTSADQLAADQQAAQAAANQLAADQQAAQQLANQLAADQRAAQQAAQQALQQAEANQTAAQQALQQAINNLKTAEQQMGQANQALNNLKNLANWPKGPRGILPPSSAAGPATDHTYGPLPPEDERYIDQILEGGP